jgi:hypothetical protein
MGEAVDFAPPGLRRDRVAVDLEDNEVPLGEIAPAFESTVSRVHLLAPRSGCDVAAHRAHPRARRECAANSDPSPSTVRMSSRLIWSTTWACDRPADVLAGELPSTASRSTPSTRRMTTGLVRPLGAIASEVAGQARMQLDAFQCVRVGAGLAQETGDPSGQATTPQANIASSPGSRRTDGSP